MKVVVGSTNKPKLAAVSKAFSAAFPDEEIVVEGLLADSGVTSHPVNGSDTLLGALNRAASAREQHPSADYYVGIEGGLIEVGDVVYEVGIMAVADHEGNVSTGMSAGIEMRGRLLKSIRSGRELNEALHDHFKIKDAGKANGFYGLTTDNEVTREQAYIQALLFALAPLKHPQYFS